VRVREGRRQARKETNRVLQYDTLQLLNLARQRRRHQEALVECWQVPRTGKDGADVFGGVAVGKDEVGFVDDEVVEVFEVEGL
jgi:hypothetical protein